MENADLVARAQAFATSAHAGQQYGSEPYETHLAAVVNVLTESGVTDPEVLAAGWLHDVVEDADVKVSQLAEAFGAGVALRVHACTGTGRNREERCTAIYRKVEAFPEAAVVKLADRIANVEAAPEGSNHIRRYRDENPAFEAAIRPYVPAPMWSRLEAALSPAE